ncbi:MAG: type II secretion system F family protein [Lachnospiraceae bacterium]|nr:type II secretion system F family protein [Lachnospiraceae bacterium]
MKLKREIIASIKALKIRLILIGTVTLLMTVLSNHMLPHGDKRPLVILVLGPLIAGLLVANRIQKEKESQKEKEILLKERYPKVVYALTAFTEGGMSAREALKRISRPDVSGDGFLYDELKLLNYELDNGLSLEKALLKFVGRVRVNEYKKLAGLLIQNERKGSVKLSEVLTMELIEADNNKIRLIKEKSEKRKVKMLIPITMLLFVVVLILMGPAFIQLNSM